MDIQLQELIEKIKRDGLESAAAEAGRLRSQAEEDAKRIVETARREADALMAKAKADAERSEKAGIAAVGQASRNLVLSFKAEIQALLDRILDREIREAYGTETLKAALPDILKGWASAPEGGALDLILPESQLAPLRAFFQDKLAGELQKGTELKSDRNLGAGFKIALKDGSAYYDFSAESVTELLAAYLNPRLAETLKEAAKDL
jgi:V/A-type H+-transporting ATPase subunit E